MSVIDTNSNGLASALQAGTANLSSIWQRYMQYRLYRKTLSEMQRMSPRELADFGLEHSELNRIAHSCVYGCDK